MRRTLAALAASAALGLAITGTADAAPAPTYAVTRTVGPYSGAAKLGEPGSVPDGEAPSVYCRPGDHSVRGRAAIRRDGFRRVLRFGNRGTFFNSENDLFGYYAFLEPTGRWGWNRVTLTVVCRRG